MHALGSWVDPRVTDTKMLLQLARLDGDAAVGVLANPNLTSGDVDEVLKTAKLTSKNVNEANMLRGLTMARTAPEMLAIARATVRRSKPAATDLVRVAAPDAQKLVYLFSLLSESAASLALRGAVVDSVRAGGGNHHDPEGRFELYLAVLHELDGWEFADAYDRLVQAAADCGRLADLPRTFDLVTAKVGPGAMAVQTHIVTALLCASLNDPSLLTSWAARHPFGALVADRDNRAVLENLSREHLLMEIAYATEPEDRFTRLCAYLLLDTLTENASWSVLEGLARDTRYLPTKVARLLLARIGHKDWLPGTAEEAHRGYLNLVHIVAGSGQPQPRLAPEPDEEAASHTIWPEGGWMTHVGPDGRLRASYPYTNVQLTTAQHWLEYERVTQSALRDLAIGTLHDALAKAVADAPAGPPVQTARNSLFGDPLGQLD